MGFRYSDGSSKTEAEISKPTLGLRLIYVGCLSDEAEILRPPLGLNLKDGCL